MIPNPSSNPNVTCGSQCLAGHSGFWWFGVETPRLSICRPAWSWSINLLDYSSTVYVKEQTICSELTPPTFSWPQCPNNQYCNVSITQCVSNQITSLTCDSQSGLFWSNSKSKCVECVSDKTIMLRKTTRGIVSPFVYTSSFKCTNNGKVVPPLAFPWNQQIQNDPSVVFKITIFVVSLIIVFIFIIINQIDSKFKFCYVRSKIILFEADSD